MKALLTILIALIFLTLPTYAQYSYTSRGDGSWSTASSWTPSSGVAPTTPGVPLLNTTDNVTIASGHTMVISADMAFAVSNPNITIDGDLFILGDVLFKLGTITVNSGGRLIVQGNLTMSDACTINNNGTSVVTGNFSMTNSTVVNPGAEFYIYGTQTHGGNGTFAGFKFWEVGNAFTASGVGDCDDNQALCDFANDTQLPVKLTYFEGFVRQDYVVLKWQTASESNSDQFIVEKSYDGERFESIGSVAAAGQSTSSIEYSFSDFEPLGTSYYRLKQTDFDGSFYYSDVVRLKLDGMGPVAKIYPNPTHKGQSINIDLGDEESSHIHIFSVDGKTDLVNTTVNQNSFSLEINDNTQAGLYVVNITSKNIIFSDLILVK